MVACGGGGSSDGSCPNDLPDQSECEGDATTYESDVAAIIDTRCVPCHGPGGQQASRDFSTYAGVHGEADAVLRQVYGCRMPPSGVDPLEPEERATILLWLVCGAKEN
jgi:mono/diheme cytochrome c family protein